MTAATLNAHIAIAAPKHTTAARNTRRPPNFCATRPPTMMNPAVTSAYVTIADPTVVAGTTVRNDENTMYCQHLS